MRINQNIAAMNAYRNLSVTQGQQAKSLERLSSGFRINRAADDAAGLAISEKLRGQVRGLDQAVSNAQNGISLLQTAEGALNESHSILQRMRELAVQSANDTNTDADREQIQKEVNQLSQELSRIGNATEFNTKNLLDGSLEDSGLTFQIGANEGQTLNVKIGDMRALELGVTADTVSATNAAGDELTGAGVTLDAGTYSIVDRSATGTNEGGTTTDVVDASGTLVGAYDPTDGTITHADGTTGVVATFTDGAGGFTDVFADGDSFTVGGVDVSSSQDAASTAITTINNAIEAVSNQRSTLGAAQNRLDHTINNLNVASENLAASESRIRDTDMAKEMMNFTRAQILSQAGTAMLAQANQVPQSVLSLLR